MEGRLSQNPQRDSSAQCHTHTQTHRGVMNLSSSPPFSCLLLGAGIEEDANYGTGVKLKARVPSCLPPGSTSAPLALWRSVLLLWA